MKKKLFYAFALAGSMALFTVFPASDSNARANANVIAGAGAGGCCPDTGGSCTLGSQCWDNYYWKEYKPCK